MPTWTLEYDLIWHGLARETYLAIELADADEKFAAGRASAFGATRKALKDYDALCQENHTEEERATRIYKPLAEKNGVSKPITAQYLARILELKSKRHVKTPEEWRAVLPPYLVSAIDYVTVAPPPSAPADGVQANV